jgi:hypothetical protein
VHLRVRIAVERGYPFERNTGAALIDGQRNESKPDSWSSVLAQDAARRSATHCQAMTRVSPLHLDPVGWLFLSPSLE